MNHISRFALAFGTASILTTSFAFAGPAGDTVEHASEAQIQDGSFGDPNTATFTVASTGTTIELPCEVATFPAKIELPRASGGNFSSVGTYRSSLAAPSSAVPVLMTGTASAVCVRGACPADANELTVTLTNLNDFQVIGTYSFLLNRTGVVNHCG